nr:odorant binding protein 7 [Apocheima cinerarius]
MECMKDFPLSLDHIQSFRSKKVPDDEVANCFSHCLYKKLGLVRIRLTIVLFFFHLAYLSFTYSITLLLIVFFS